MLANAAGHEAIGKQHATYTTRKFSCIAAKCGKEIKRKMPKVPQINAFYDSSDDVEVAIMSKKEESAVKLAQTKDTAKDYVLKKTRNIKLAQQQYPVFA